MDRSSNLEVVVLPHTSIKDHSVAGIALGELPLGTRLTIGWSHGPAPS